MMQKSSSTPLPAQINPSWRIGIVASSFYADEINALINGAKKTFHNAGIADDCVSVHMAPGSFEIPLIGAALAEKKSVDALIGFGIIVEGETQHARLLAEATTRGIMQTQLKYHIPFAFEVLYVNTIDDARARTIGDHNKGIEAAHAVLQSLATLAVIQDS